VPNDVSVGLKWTNRKIGKIVSLYQQELFKKTAFCTQSIKEWLKTCGMINLLCISLLVCKLSSSQAAWSLSVLWTAWLYNCRVCSMVNQLDESEAKSQACPGSQICWFVRTALKWVLYFCISCQTKCIMLFEVSVMITGQFIDVMSSYVDVWSHSLVSPKTVLIFLSLSDHCASLDDSACSMIELYVNIVSHDSMFWLLWISESIDRNCCCHVHS
jgi:hypothetical protein